MTRFVLLVILGLVAALYFPESRAVILDKIEPAMTPVLRWQTHQELEEIARDLQTHEREHYGQIPGRREWLAWLKGSYTTADATTDAWGSTYQLQVQRDSFAVVSSGPDQVFGTDDDVVSKRKLMRPRRP